MRYLFTSIILIMLSFSFFSEKAEASTSFDKAMVLELAGNQLLISKAEAIAAVKRQVEGKVLSAKLINSQGPPVYRVKVLLAKGRVRTVFVDGLNGRVIRIR